MKIKVIGHTKNNWVSGLTTANILVLCKPKRSDIKEFVKETFDLWIDIDEFKTIKRVE